MKNSNGLGSSIPIPRGGGLVGNSSHSMETSGPESCRIGNLGLTGAVREEVLRRSMPRTSLKCMSSRNQLWIEDQSSLAISGSEIHEIMQYNHQMSRECGKKGKEHIRQDHLQKHVSDAQK